MSKEGNEISSQIDENNNIIENNPNEKISLKMR